MTLNWNPAPPSNHYYLAHPAKPYLRIFTFYLTVQI